jgi:hypothetical protein
MLQSAGNRNCSSVSKIVTIISIATESPLINAILGIGIPVCASMASALIFRKPTLSGWTCPKNQHYEFLYFLR